jgi:Raf kinase inhibitor-like YbhB/YbcL family protein
MCPLLALLFTALPWKTPSAAGMSLHSTAFAHNGTIPERYTCQSDDVSPPLRWRDVPSGAKSLVLIVDDPDAPDPRAPKVTWVHWVLYNLPPESDGLPTAVTSKDLPAGTEEALNSWGRTGYGGPCPPIGRHRYFFKLYAVDTKLDGLPRPNKDAIVEAMQGHIVEETQLMGTYEKTP